ANEFYAEGSHGVAAEVYEAILAGGFLNADIYYNLANARYMDGDIAQAVLGYERALRLDGSHEDAAANLEFVREQLADRQVRVGGALSEALDRFVRKAEVGRLAVVVSTLYFVVVGCIIAGVLRGAFQPWLLRAIVVVVILLVLMGGLLGYRIHRTATVLEGVVVAADVPVRTGPGDDFVLEFRLHEGTKVRLREARDDWTRVSVEGTDLEGWLPERAVEEI
ncbi:MAG: tetratricopeptide repeat protein, partial [Candidatus Eisenbacteria sp.]|nr:tetratricopeptide repeat protein [Candidatus Eisenbacteria bacterium]